jgi:hypothetical protein
MYVYLFVISLWCSKKHERPTITASADNLPYLRFRKKHLRVVIARKRAVECVVVMIDGHRGNWSIPNFFGNQLLI